LTGPRYKRSCGKSSGYIAPNCMVLVTVDPTFTLLNINRIPREIPVHNPRAVGMKIQSFLSN